jgi:hypothetical protein
MANKVDEGGSSKVYPGPTIGPLHPIPQIGPKYPVIPPKPIVIPPKPVYPSQNAGAPIAAYTPPMSNYIPPPIPAKPLVMTDPAAFEKQDSAAVNQVVKTPTAPVTPYVPGDAPTPDQAKAMIADLKAHPEWWIYAGAETAGITQADAARIKGQIPFAEIMPIQGEKINFSTGIDESTGQPYGVKTTTPSSPSGPSEPALTESGDLTLEEPVLPDITWEEKYHVEGAPDWWRGVIPSRYDPQSEYASMLNSMIPFMSPEDQRYAASFLYRMYPTYFPSYSSFASNETIPQAPTEITTDQRQYMTSYQRAQSILDTLAKVKEVSGNPKLGPGYAYLQELGSVLRDYGAKGTGNSQTRQQYSQMMGALDPLVAEGQQENLSSFSALTRMLTQPYYTGGQLHPTTTLQDNSVISGTPIKNYF